MQADRLGPIACKVQEDVELASSAVASLLAPYREEMSAGEWPLKKKKNQKWSIISVHLQARPDVALAVSFFVATVARGR